MFWSKLCKSSWNCAWNLAFPVFISPIVWNMCKTLPYESVYFKELHNEQECYWSTIYRAGAAVVSTITSFSFRVINMLALPSRFCCAFISTGNKITKTVIVSFRTSMVDRSSSGNRQCVRNFFELDLLTKISENNTRRYLWWRKNKLKKKKFICSYRTYLPYLREDQIYIVRNGLKFEGKCRN